MGGFSRLITVGKPGLTKRLRQYAAKVINSAVQRHLMMPKGYFEAVTMNRVKNMPKNRGEFDPYKIFHVEYPWQKYMNIPDEELKLWEKFDKWAILRSRSNAGWDRLGLLCDDTIRDEDPMVIEAVNRLPYEVREARDRRIARAHDLSMHSTELPRELWTKPEDDVPYLLPYILWVSAEMEELDAEYERREDLDLKFLPRFSAKQYEGGLIYKKRLAD